MTFGTIIFKSKSETEKARRPSVDIRDESELEVVELQPGQRIWETFQSQTVRIKLPNKQVTVVIQYEERRFRRFFL